MSKLIFEKTASKDLQDDSINIDSPINVSIFVIKHHLFAIVHANIIEIL